MTTVIIVHVITTMATWLAATTWFREKLVYIYESIHLRSTAYLVFSVLLIVVPVFIANVALYIIDQNLMLLSTDIKNGYTIILYIILFIITARELKILIK